MARYFAAMPRPPRISLDDYAWDRIDELNDCGGAVTDYAVTSTDDDTEIQIIASIELEFVSLQLLEVVVMARGRPHRRKYSYHCQDGERLVFRYDRDPEGHPRMPEHKHVGPSGRRSRTGPIRLRDVFNEAWAYVEAHWAE